MFSSVIRFILIFIALILSSYYIFDSAFIKSILYSIIMITLIILINFLNNKSNKNPSQ